MTQTTSSLDAAIERLVHILGGGGGQAETPQTPQAPQPTTTPSQPTTTSQPAARGLSQEDRVEIMRICMYSQAVPLITPEVLEELRSSLPALVDRLGSLKEQPQQRRLLLDYIKTLGYENVERSADGAGGLEDLLGRDLNTGERIIPLIALGIGAAALGYNIGHTWGR